jgi:hypothetical protein
MSDKKQSMEYEADKYYADFAGRIVGPYDTEVQAWEDTGGDVAWIALGKELDTSAE